MFGDVSKKVLFYNNTEKIEKGVDYRRLFKKYRG